MKKVLSLVLAVVLVASMSTVAFAATTRSNKIDVDGAVTYTVGYSNDNEVLYGANESYFNWSDNEGFARADESLELYLDPANFINTREHYNANPGHDEYKDAGLASENFISGLTTSRLSSANIDIKKKVSKGSDVIEKIELKNYTSGSTKTVYVNIELIEYFVSTGEKDFDFTIYLAKKSKKIDGTTVQIGGTIKNNEIVVEEEDDEVDLSDGQSYVKADDYVKAIQIEAGNGIFINTKMFSGSKYYAVATQDISSSDDAIIARYPEIDTIYTLYTVNLGSASNTVEIDVDDTYYVYDNSGKYIGTTADKLPMSSKYYLATSQIDMGGTTVDDDTTTSVPVEDTENAITGGDEAPANANDNPGTGC